MLQQSWIGIEAAEELNQECGLILRLRSDPILKLKASNGVILYGIKMHTGVTIELLASRPDRICGFPSVLINPTRRPSVTFEYEVLVRNEGTNCAVFVNDATGYVP